MVNTLSGSVSAYRKEETNKRYYRVEDVMGLFEVSKEDALDIALAAGARYQLAKITLIHKERLMSFSHLRTARVGKTIEQRLKRMMSYSEAQDIIKKLKKINKTLVFTDNPNESRDLYATISKEEQLTINR